MSLFDRITPSERVADLTLVVRRLRKLTGSPTIPMLIVEGPSDESLLGLHCSHGHKQVFAAGTRGLVEQMLVFLRGNPIPGSACVFLTDCDGRGKAPSLKHEADLIVTHGCDMEADLVILGVAERVSDALAGTSTAAIVSSAVEMSLPLSVLRRRAEQVGVSMKRHKRRLRLTDVDGATLAAWASAPPEEAVVLNVVAHSLGWSRSEEHSVAAAAVPVPLTFERYGSGKDALDALWFLLDHYGLVRGMTADAFQAKILRGLSTDDLSRWEVGRRLDQWQQSQGLELVPLA